MCAALLLGLFAGGGITWGVLSQRPVKTPLIVYQLPPPGVVPPDAPDAAKDPSSREPDPARSVRSLDVGSPAPFRGDAGDALPEPAAGPPIPSSALPDDETGPAAVGWNRSTDRLPLATLRIDSDSLLHGHPKAEGCLADALAALAPFLKKGFNLRDKVWDGVISLEEGKAVSCQLFKGNEYVFCVGTDAKGAKLSLQLYSSNGEPTDAGQSGQELAAGASATACWHCNQTGTYFVVVKLETATQEKVPWGMVSAYR